MRRQLSAITVWFLAALPLQAQRGAADSAWVAGDFHRARINYERMLTEDSASVRANYRLGILASWDGRLDSALVLIRRARLVEPLDPDLRVAEARILSWAGRSDRAVALYDSVLMEHPRHLDGLTGLGQVYLWQGKYSVAKTYSARALGVEADNRSAIELDRAIARATRPQPELTLGWSNDSDDNTSWWQTLSGSYLLRDGLRAFGSLGALEASDPFRNAHRLSAEAGLTYGLGNLFATAALGGRRLSPDTAAGRTAGTARISAGYRLGRAGVGIGYSHYPFDETALLIERTLDVDAFELSGDATIGPGLNLGAGASFSSLSDDNARNAGILALTQTIRRDFFVGAMARALGYDFPGLGYFSPDWFAVYEVRAGYTRSSMPWSGRVSGGLGVQQVGSEGRTQSEWHLEGRLGRSWGSMNLVEIFAGISNSAESSTTGAFEYRTAGILVRIGL
jgi:tetratricopeptide (TPR) repeat protein